MVDRRDEHPLIPMSAKERRAMQQSQLSRRSFLRRSGGLPVAVAGGAALAGGAVQTVMTQETTTPSGLPADWPQFDGVPETPHSPPPEGFQALTEEEAAVVEALTARLIPGSPEDPGAREAGVVYYIDYLLSENDGIWEHTYQAGPWARGYEGDTEPEPEEGVIWVPAEELERYGYQSPLTPLEIYQMGIAAIEAYAQVTWDSGVADLSEEDQDQIIWDLLDEKIPIEAFSSISFFHTLRQHTAQGMFSDPAYGGNRNLAGWRLVGFPGAQRAYDPEEMQTEQEPREPMTMHELPEFNPGQTEDGPVLPVRGTDPEDGGE